MISNDYKNRIIYISFIILIILLGLILKTNSRNIEIFSTNKYIGFLTLLISFIFAFVLIKNDKNILLQFSLFVIFSFVSVISISAIITRSIIFFGENKTNTEYFIISKKKIIDNHGVGYFLRLNNYSKEKNIQINVKEDVFKKMKQNDTIFVKYFTIKKLIKYTNRYDCIIDSLTTFTSATPNTTNQVKPQQKGSKVGTLR